MKGSRLVGPLTGGCPWDCYQSASLPPSTQEPKEWNTAYNPAYVYYTYYVYANLYTLNKFREARGLNAFDFRPHAGEAGDLDHLIATYMVCPSISHGINLKKSPPL